MHRIKFCEVTMKKNQEETGQNTCDNCRYFNVHYVKVGCCFHKLNEGHCTCPKLNLYLSDRIITNSRTCKHWEPISIAIEERKKSIFKNIEYMERHLCEITQMLKEDLDIKHNKQ